MTAREPEETTVYGEAALRSAKSFAGYTLLATDGEIGKVRDMYFDDDAWTVRYLVVDTGAWLPGRSVLISPASASGRPDAAAREIPVSLSREQVRSSPSAETHKPVSRRHEMNLAAHYNWPAYWTFGGFYNIAPPPPDYETERELQYEREEEEVHLRSMGEVEGYHIQALDGEVGHIEDFILDEEEWKIRYLIVDTRNWLPGRKVVLSPEWVSDISWDERKVYVEFATDEIKDSPEYDPALTLSKEYEQRLRRYYDRQGR